MNYWKSWEKKVKQDKSSAYNPIFRLSACSDLRKSRCEAKLTFLFKLAQDNNQVSKVIHLSTCFDISGGFLSKIWELHPIILFTFLFQNLKQLSSIKLD